MEHRGHKGSLHVPRAYYIQSGELPSTFYDYILDPVLYARKSKSHRDKVLEDPAAKVGPDR